MAIVLKDAKLAKKYRIVSEVDKIIVNREFNFEGPISSIKNEEQLKAMIGRKSNMVEEIVVLEKVVDSKKT